MSGPTSNLPYHPPISSDSPSPPESPASFPERNPTYSHSAPSFDRLPPVMSAQGNTPAPSDDHSDMVAHNANIVLEDDDHHGDHSLHSYDHPPSRPLTPPVPPTTATAIVDPFSDSITTTSSSTFSSTFSQPDTALSSAGSSTSTVSPSQTAHSDHHRSHSLSPFSFFTLGHHGGDHPAGSSKTLRIELTHPEVVLMNGQSTVLEGVVYLSLNKNAKVKTLQLEFSGRSSVTWVDDNAYSPATRHTTAPHIEHSWTLISHQHKQPPTQLQSGQHAYPFSLELSETLPETLTTTHGKVAYRLTATLTKPGLTFNSSTATIPVTILRRHPVQGLRAYQRGGRLVSAPEDKVKYKITLPQIRVSHSTKIPLQVSITAPTPRIQVQVLQVGLWERVVYRADGRKRVDMRLVKIQKSEGWDRPANNDTEAWNWNKILLFDMPQIGPELSQCNPSADNGLMKVGHILRFSILGTDGAKRFRVENEVDLKVLAFEDEYQVDPDEEGNGDNELPSYLSSFTTPRVSFDSEREMDPADDDLLRLMVQRIHLPTYAESEEEVNSRGTSRDSSQFRSLSSVHISGFPVAPCFLGTIICSHACYYNRISFRFNCDKLPIFVSNTLSASSFE
ncbi:hypothetical protein BGZ65_003953 [Modicella reniformis]|uniref:Arrestin C-terminal-like domain-containing protein n=1 Tax=Modicella reniformis TaxID=1440133 RepID=A0A9P6IKG5_9FUNG|nr:hypothetical protein BGZ65_003953 [Modicella reniformis]